MLNAITPISYMAFYNSDKRFFEMDSANGLYAPSAYYMAAAAAGRSAHFCLLLMLGRQVRIVLVCLQAMFGLASLLVGQEK